MCSKCQLLRSVEQLHDVPFEVALKKQSCDSHNSATFDGDDGSGL
jgi:hypothetical protein